MPIKLGEIVINPQNRCFLPSHEEGTQRPIQFCITAQQRDTINAEQEYLWENRERRLGFRKRLEVPQEPFSHNRTAKRFQAVYLQDNPTMCPAGPPGELFHHAVPGSAGSQRMPIPGECREAPQAGEDAIVPGAAVPPWPAPGTLSGR
jgi:hypothetical protein